MLAQLELMGNITAAGSRSTSPAFGKDSESDQRSLVLKPGGYLLSLAVGFVTSCIGSAISSHSFKHTYMCVYAFAHECEGMYDSVCWAKSFCHTDTNLGYF